MKQETLSNIVQFERESQRIAKARIQKEQRLRSPAIKQSASNIFAVADALKDMFPNLDAQEMVSYVSNNTETLHSTDGYEALQIIWGSHSHVITNLLCSKQARDDHGGASKNGTWVLRKSESREVIRQDMLSRLDRRRQQRCPPLEIA